MIINIQKSIYIMIIFSALLFQFELVFMFELTTDWMELCCTLWEIFLTKDTLVCQKVKWFFKKILKDLCLTVSLSVSFTVPMVIMEASWVLMGINHGKNCLILWRFYKGTILNSLLRKSSASAVLLITQGFLLKETYHLHFTRWN